MDEKERAFQWWMTNLYCDRNTAEGKERVESVMSHALNAIISDDEKLTTLESVLFETHISFGDNKTAMRALCDMIEAQLLAVFEREQQKTADHS